MNHLLLPGAAHLKPDDVVLKPRPDGSFEYVYVVIDIQTEGDPPTKIVADVQYIDDGRMGFREWPTPESFNTKINVLRK